MDRVGKGGKESDLILFDRSIDGRSGRRRVTPPERLDSSLCGR